MTLEGEPHGNHWCPPRSLSVALRAAEEGLGHAEAEVERLRGLLGTLKYAQKQYG